MSAWRVLGEAAVESRFAAIRTGTLPLVGRAHEMGLMLERWRLARSGEGQIVTVVGEAGIGKSRAIEALQEDVAHEPHTPIRLRGECLLALGRDRKEEARQSFATARDVARQQGAVIFERRAEASLAEVANSRGV